MKLLHRTLCSIILLCSLLIGSVPAWAATATLPAASPAPAALQQNAQRFSPSADTTIAFSAPDGNFNDVPELLVNDGGLTAVIDSDALLQFDLSAIPTDAVILDAQLRLVQINGSGGYSLVVSRIEEAWDAATVTWATQPAASGNFGFRQTTGDGPETLLWDVTTLVRRWSYTPGETPNHGLKISGIPDSTGQGRSSLHSLEADAALRPVLSVSWQVPPSEIAIPLGAENIDLDSFCNTETEYADALAFAFRDADSTASQLFVKHTNEHLYLCVQGRLSRSDEAFFSAYLDVDNGREALAEPDDLSLRVRPEDGGTSEWIGAGAGGYEQIDARAWQADASAGDLDNAEYRIPLPLFERYCGAPFGLALYHQDVDAAGDDYGWPSNEFANQPQTWLSATLAERGCPFRVQVLDNDGLPSADATVYRLTNGELTDEFATDEFGFVQDGGVISATDSLWALDPVSPTTYATLPPRARFYHTSGRDPVAVADGVPDVNNILTLPASAQTPLMVRDFEVSTLWYIEDSDFDDELTQNLLAAANYFYDWTDGQFALGNITVHQAQESWDAADLQVNPGNVFHPNATIGGGVVLAPTTETISGTLEAVNSSEQIAATAVHTYTPGAVRMGRGWNGYGVPVGQSITVDGETFVVTDETFADHWSLTAAHELGHYLLFLFDTYTDANGNSSQALADSCRTAMGNVYEFHGNEFAFDWTAVSSSPGACKASEAYVDTVGRSEWQTIQAHHPWTVIPEARDEGPLAPPVPLTTVTISPTVAPTQPLVSQRFNLGYIDSKDSSGEARAFLMRGNRIYEQGKPPKGTTYVDLVDARAEDRLCVYDINDHAEGEESERHQFACEPIKAGDDVLTMTQNLAWEPIVTLAQTGETTVAITVEQPLAAGELINVSLFPEHGALMSTVALAPNERRDVHTATVDFGAGNFVPALYGQLWIEDTVVEPSTRREVVVDRGTGGGGAFGHLSEWGGTLILSSDGKASFKADELIELLPVQSIALQSMPGTPPLRRNQQIIGQSYRLDAFPASLVELGTIRIEHQIPSATADVAAASSAQTNDFGLYFWNGESWRRLDTIASVLAANAQDGAQVISARSQGVGVYAVLRETELDFIFLPLIAK